MITNNPITKPITYKYPKPLNLTQAKALLRERGISINYNSSLEEYRVDYSWCRGNSPSVYFTSDLMDAFWTGMAMGEKK